MNIQRQCCQCIFSVLSVTEMQQKELSLYLIPLVAFVAVLDRAVLWFCGTGEEGAAVAAALLAGRSVDGVPVSVGSWVLTWCWREACLWYKPSHGTQKVSLHSWHNLVAIDSPHIRQSALEETWVWEPPLAWAWSIPSSASSYSESPSLSAFRSETCSSTVACSLC